MNRIFEYTITDENLPCTVGDFLKQKGFSRQIIIQLKKTSQGILVNNQWAYVRTPLRTNDILTLRLLEEAPSENIVPVSLPLDIIYEDEDILLINKPADMPVHPSINNYDNTLAMASRITIKCREKPLSFAVSTAWTEILPDFLL